MKRWRPPRPLIVIALLLLAGAVVNVGVAWDSAARRLPTSGQYGSDLVFPDRFDEPPIAWGAVKGLRADRRCWFTDHFGAMYAPVEFMLGIDLAQANERPPEDFAADWGLLFIRRYHIRFDFEAGKEEAHGWPFRSLWGALVWDRDSLQQRPVWAIALSDSAGSPLRDAHYLPLRPIFPGFLLNTFFYAVAVAPILTLPLGFLPIRRRLRARRGRCPQCAYDRTGLPDPAAPCPECGAAR